MDKNYIKMIQGFEQASAMMKPFANFIGVYFKNLIENGFTRQEALALVENYQIMIFNRAFEMNNNQNIDFGDIEEQNSED